MTSSLYIHIPFCASKCNYCSFNSYTGLDGLHGRYVKALCAELHQDASEGNVDPLRTIFMGGGTPTLLSGRLLEQIFSLCSEQYTFSSDIEISIEANPGTVDMEKLQLLQACGVNRLSIGVQSFDNHELDVIGRIHTNSEAIVAVELAKEVGFTNISVDLMYGLPGQSPKSWQASLETAFSLGVNHLSLYQLTVEAGTPLTRILREKKLQLPGEEEIAAMDRITAEFTAAEGFSQYEISNYAQSGFQSRHNITYWENRDYLGVGAGAVSCKQGCRRQNIASPSQYNKLMEADESVVVEEETLDREASFRETVIMGLRMNRGVSLDILNDRYGILPERYYGNVLQQLIFKGFIERKAGYLLLTGKGRMFANGVMAELV